MPVALKRRYLSSSSSESASWVASRPKCPLPIRRVRKVARHASSHRIATIPASRQQHRSASCASTSETDVSSSDTELGTALSEVETVIPSGLEPVAEKSFSDDGMELSSPCKEENEVDDGLGSVGMSSPGPPPPVWYRSRSGRSKSQEAEDRPLSDIKRRRIEQVMDDDAEADDEMEETEMMMSTPKQKAGRTFKTRKCAFDGLSTRAVAPTPSIQRITDGFHELTPYSLEMQISPDLTATTDRSSSDDEHDSARVYDSLIPSSPSPSAGPGPSRHRPLPRLHFSRPIGRARRSDGRKRSHQAGPKSSSIPTPGRPPHPTAPASVVEQNVQYAEDPFCAQHMTALLKADFTEPIAGPTSPDNDTPSWSYGPLSSPIRLLSEPPSTPLHVRILPVALLGQRTRPNKNLQRRSPTSLVPSRHLQRGRCHKTPSSRTSRRPLALFGTTSLVGQHVITYIHQMKEARTKRRNAVARQNALVDISALCAMRARCFEHFAKVDAWKNLLDDIQKGCWWWPQPVSLDEIRVDCLVGNVAMEAEEDVVAVIEMIEAPPEPLSPTPSEAARVRRAEAAEMRRENLQSESDAHQARMVSHARARSTREVEWTRSSDRAAAQHRQLGRRSNPTVVEPTPVRHTSALNPAWLNAIRIPSIVEAPNEPPATFDIEIEDTDNEEDSEVDSDVSDPPAYNSGTYPRHIPIPAHLRPRAPSPAPQPSLPHYANNRYSRRSPSPPPPYNAETDRQTIVAPTFIGEDDDDEEEVAPAAAVATMLGRNQRVVGAFPSRVGSAWSGEQAARNRFDAALDMEEGDDRDMIDEMTGAFAPGQAEDTGVTGVIGGFFGRIFGRW